MVLAALPFIYPIDVFCNILCRARLATKAATAAHGDCMQARGCHCCSGEWISVTSSISSNIPVCWRMRPPILVRSFLWLSAVLCLPGGAPRRLQQKQQSATATAAAAAPGAAARAARTAARTKTAAASRLEAARAATVPVYSLLGSHGGAMNYCCC